MKVLRLVFLMLLFQGFSSNAYASEIDKIIEEEEKVIEYEQIQSTIDSLIKGNEIEKPNFRQVVWDLIKGKQPFDSGSVLKTLIYLFFTEIKVNLNLLIKIIGITIIAALFTNFANSYKNKYISEVGYFVVFLLLATLIIQSYNIIYAIAKDTLSNLMVFMQALVPSLFATAAFSGNFTSSFIYNQVLLTIMGVINGVFLKWVLPFIYIILVLELVNSITEENVLSRLLELLKTIVNWSIKILVVLLITALGIQSFTAPVLDGITHKSVKVAVSAIPIVGSTLTGVADTVLGCAVLIKNGVGIAALITIIIICAIPIIKMLSISLLYKLTAAIIQPISDKRVTSLLSNIGDICLILLGVVVISAFLFIIAITIILNATNVSAYIR